MPRGFSNNSRARPSAQLFAVHRLAENKLCCDEQEDVSIDGLDDIANSIDRLIDDEDLMQDLLGCSPKPPQSGSALTGSPIKITPALLEQASIWSRGEPLSGSVVPCTFSGPGAQFETGTAVQPPGQQDLAPPSVLVWTPVPTPPITHDAHGVSIEPAMCTLGDMSATVSLNPQLLFWQARRQWMWHRKWSLPSITVEVRSAAPALLANIPLYVHITAGTRPEGSETLCDVGLVGECQSRLTLDASGRGTVTFARLLFQHTSFNCGARPFHLTVSVLADVPPAAAGSESPWSGGLGGGAPHASVSPPAANAFGEMARSLGMPDPMDLGTSEALHAPPAHFAPFGAPPARRALVSLCSQPVHVDARKRSKAERADAADDDVRIVCRPSAGRSNQPPPSATMGRRAARDHGAPREQMSISMRAPPRAAPPFAAVPPSLPPNHAPNQGPTNGFAGWLDRLIHGDQQRQTMHGAPHPSMMHGAPHSSPQPPMPSYQPMAAPAAAAPPLGAHMATDQGHRPTGNTLESVFVVRADSVVLQLISPGAFGYTPQQLVGQPLAAITVPAEHANLLQALQVLVKVHEITKMTGQASSQSLHMVHHILLGVGGAHRASPVIAVESIVKVIDNWATPASGGKDSSTKLLFHSRPAVAPDSMGLFRMELVAA